MEVFTLNKMQTINTIRLDGRLQLGLLSWMGAENGAGDAHSSFQFAKLVV